MSSIQGIGSIIFKLVLTIIFYFYSVFSFFQTFFYSNKSKERLIIFTRYPQENETKKRLIPKLGAKAAMELHKEMAAFVVKKACLLQTIRPTEIYIYFTHNKEELDYKNLMKEWLGHNFHYMKQTGSNLGERLLNSVVDAYKDGIEKVVVMGTDIPDINHNILNNAFKGLDKYDSVTGPAKDGGYYLIGLTNRNRKEWRTIFQDIAWGTSHVYEETISRFKVNGMKWLDLEVLQDVDEPEDIEVFEKAKEKFIEKERISIIIPTYNEEDNIEKTIQSLRKFSNNIEIIVVDGGSEDDTVNVVQNLENVAIYEVKGGKAAQMNLGVKHSTGDILLFLHADTIVPSHYDSLIRETLKMYKTIMGAFSFSVKNKKVNGIQTMEKFTNWRCRQFQLPYGDQGLFIYKGKFTGFKEMAFMEDYEFVVRCQAEGMVRIVNSPVITSSRRWEKNGVLYSVVLNQIFVILYNLGVSTETIKAWYYN